LSLLADSEGNIELANCFVQQQLDLKRKIHCALGITCLGGLNRALCELVCVIDKIGDTAQGGLEAAIHIAAHVPGLTVGSSQNAAESNTSGLHANSKKMVGAGAFPDFERRLIEACQGPAFGETGTDQAEPVWIH
jgi:hypothetical protein